MLPFLVILSIYESKTKYKTFKLSSNFTSLDLSYSFVCLGISFMMVQIGYILSGQYTIMSHASILSNLGGAFIVVGRVIMRKPVHNLEYLGLLIAFVGSAISIMDKEV